MYSMIKVLYFLSVPSSASASTPGLLNGGGDNWRQGSGGANNGRHKQHQPGVPMPSALRSTSGAPPSGITRDVTFDDKTETFGSDDEKEKGVSYSDDSIIILIYFD